VSQQSLGASPDDGVTYDLERGLECPLDLFEILISVRVAEEEKPGRQDS
jgi:hypothetical protein